MADASLNPLTRFTDRVDDYARYRPSYPAELIDYLRAHGGLGPDAPVADVGAGTGILTRLLLEAGAKVFAVEPNGAMRAAAEASLADYPRFVSVDGAGERTGLPDSAIRLITCAQAFHWMDAGACRREFRRISAPGAQWAMIWNSAVVESDFGRGYERVKSEFGTDFHRVRHESLERQGRFDLLYGAGRWSKHEFANSQELDWDGLRGRLLSSSYAPARGHPNHEPMIAALRGLFEATQRGGRVRMDYRTELFIGPTR